jgi:predicted transcriptional regulator
MTSGIVTVDADATCHDAVSMAEDRLGSVLVVDHGHLVGIVTETDLLRRIVGRDACCADVEAIVVSHP